MIEARSFLRALAAGAAIVCLGPAAFAAQQTFPTPDDAAKALVAALGSAEDEAPFRALFESPRIDELRGSADAVEWREDRLALHRAAQESVTVRRDSDDVAVLVLGAKAWPFPIPLVRENGAWRFDTDAGVEEILNRRIGEHELAAVELLQAYVDAQVEYASEDRDGDQVMEYAQRLRSSDGKHDGLWWPDAADAPPSPLGEFVASANAAPYAGQAKAGAPYRGYYFHVLTKQGSHAPGGAYDFVINGNMIAGFAAVAFPADYGKSGIMTFVVSHQGKVYEKDLGAGTKTAGTAMKTYDPDGTWNLVAEDLEAAE